MTGQEANRNDFRNSASFSERTHVSRNRYFNLAVTEQSAGDFAAARIHYSQALRFNPSHVGALNNLSDLLRMQGRSALAWQCADRFIEAGGDPRGLEIRFAKIADECNRPNDARYWFGRAAEHDSSPALRWESAMQQLRDEEFSQGWENYEARREIFDHHTLGLVNYPESEWDGVAKPGASLLLHKEQGLGDMIMFAILLGNADLAGMDVHLAVQPPLARLFAANFPWAKVWASSSTAKAPDASGQQWYAGAGPFDSQLPLASLGRVAQIDFADAPKAYISADEADTHVWASRMEMLAGNMPSARIKAGLVIAARPSGPDIKGGVNGADKTLDPTAAALLAIDGVRWFGLHNGPTSHILSEVPDLDLIDCSPWLFDLADTAAVIANLDVVVAVDTAVAHLAGAMGKTVILMLQHRPDWRWGRCKSTSYWYPDVTILQQEIQGDWWSVVRRARQHIEEML